MRAEVGEEVKPGLATADAVSMESLHVRTGVWIRKVPATIHVQASRSV